MNRLKKLRLEANELQSDLAKLLCVTARTIGHYETENRAMTPDTIIKLAEHYNVSTDYLLGKTNTKNQNFDDLYNGKIYLDIYIKDYNNITKKQREQLNELAKIILKDNLKKNKHKKIS